MVQQAAGERREAAAMMRREEGRRELGSAKVQQPLALVKAYAPAATPWQGGQGWPAGGQASGQAPAGSAGGDADL